MLVYCWPTVCDAGPALNQHWFTVQYLLSSQSSSPEIHSTSIPGEVLALWTSTRPYCWPITSQTCRHMSCDCAHLIWLCSRADLAAAALPVRDRTDISVMWIIRDVNSYSAGIDLKLRLHLLSICIWPTIAWISFSKRSLHTYERRHATRHDATRFSLYTPHATF